MRELAGQIVMAAGLLLAFAGCIALVRLPDVCSRIQAAVKGVALGIAVFLAGVLFLSGIDVLGVVAVAVCLAIVALFSPVAAYAVAHRAFRPHAFKPDDDTSVSQDELPDEPGAEAGRPE